MTKIGIVLLACLVMILLACSPEAPAAEPTMDATAGASHQEPTSAPHASTPPATVPPAPPPAASTATTASPEPTTTPASDVPSPTPELPSTSTPSAQPGPAETAGPTVSPAPGADAVPTILLVLTMAEVPAELPVYSRDDWRHWIGEDGDCQDPRNEVLLASSLADVAYRSDRRCRVASGQWFAPYSGTLVTVPGELDIDHMVSLADAHRSGAWQWSPELKRLYANYLDDPNHLIAVTARANRSKGARGPEEWKPPDRSYWCRYAVDWTTIKHKWDLTATPAEFAALDGMLNTCDTTHLLGVAVTFEKPNLPTFGAALLRPLPLPAVQTADTIPVRTPSPQVNPASSEARARVAVSPRRWCPAHGTAMGTA